ncbi:hypothetical protein [Aquitalea palustris]|uniref:hypothetical protein n=1 Tax=Aquitalea palustris TaxID=2480983 RepID=UPI001CF01F9B|nr:hypothetical protein [Aquitalea palustris]
MQDRTRKFSVRPVPVEQKIGEWPAGLQAEVVPAWHMLLVGQSNQPKSIMDDMTQNERKAFNQWLSEQAGDPERGGAIDGMKWPGWGDVVVRRAKERSTK